MHVEYGFDRTRQTNILLQYVSHLLIVEQSITKPPESIVPSNLCHSQTSFMCERRLGMPPIQQDSQIVYRYASLHACNIKFATMICKAAPGCRATLTVALGDETRIGSSDFDNAALPVS